MPKTKSETAPEEAQDTQALEDAPTALEDLSDQIEELQQALSDANTKIEELRNANEVLTYENANLTTKLESWQGTDAKTALDQQIEQNSLKITECENLKREIEEVKNTHKGVLRFLHDPTNSPNEKKRLLESELAKS